MKTTARGQFPPTRWTLVRRWRDGTGPGANEALAELCALYWYPLYAYARRSGNSPADAEDMTQGFFEQLLERRYLDEVSSDKGKLRTFLLVALKHYMAKQWRRDHAEKRGGRQRPLSIEQDAAEERLKCVSNDLPPDRFYDRHWATTLLKRVGDRLRSEFAAKEKSDLFDALQSFLSLRKPDQPYAEVARRLDMTENAVAVAAHRMRRRFRELLRQEVADTVGSWEEIDEELARLRQILS